MVRATMKEIIPMISHTIIFSIFFMV